MPTRTRDPWRRAAAAALALALLVACGAPVAPDPDPDPSPAPLTIETVAPVPDATGVAVTTSVSATFSGAVDPATVTGAFTLTPAGGTAVAGTVTLGGDGRSVTFVPSENLAYATPYAVAVAGTVASIDGGTLAGDATWSFSTEPAPEPAAPAIDQLGTGFAVAPAGVVFDAPYAVTAPDDGAAVACTLTLDGAPLATVDPCTSGSVELGPFATGAGAELALVATTADGGEASAVWSFTTAAWAPFQRLELGGDVRALAGSDDLLAVLTDADTDALAVLRRPNAAIPAGTWAPAEAAVEDVLPRAGGHAIAWYRDQLAWLGAVEEGFAPVDFFTGDAEFGWGPSRILGVSWAGDFVGAPSFAVSNTVIVVGDGAAGDGRWRARNGVSDVDLDETSDLEFVLEPPGPGEGAGTAVAALDDVVLIGGPGYTFPGAEAFSPNGRVQAVATADGVEPRAGGFSSGPGSRVGEHLAVVWTPAPAVFMAGAFEVQWAQVRVRPGGDDGSDETVLEALGDLPLEGARWIAVNVPPSRGGGGDTIAAALLAVGLPDDTVALYFVPFAEGFDPTPLGTLDATGASGPGAWVGNALALPYGDAIVLYDLSAPPVE